MKIDIDCIGCFVHQAENIIKKFVKDREKRINITRNVLKKLIEIPQTDLKPIELYPYCYSILYDELNIEDFYKGEKEKTNNIMKSILPYFIDRIKQDNSLKNSIKLSIAGNLIDYGIKDIDRIVNGEIKNILTSYLEKDFYVDDFEKFLKLLQKAKNIVFLTDNSGEIIFDKIFLSILKESFPELNIYIAGRDINVLNDITYDELITLGFNEIGIVVKNGVKIPGAVEKMFNKEFTKIWENADIIISKGQGNYEGLSDIKDKKIFFALVAKCNLIAQNLGVPKMSMVFKASF